MAQTRWSREDERVLAALYERVGADWDGWAALLPGRGPAGIRSKAERMGLRFEIAASYSRPAVLDEGEVMRMLRGGFEPSRIDRVLGLESGTAHDLIVQEWAADKRAFGTHV